MDDDTRSLERRGDRVEDSSSFRGQAVVRLGQGWTRDQIGMRWSMDGSATPTTSTNDPDGNAIDATP